MRELHVVAVSEDGRHVVLSARKGPVGKAEFRVAMDDRLKAAMRGTLPRLGEHEAPESAVTPKDIQARLRAGETVEQIAASAGVPDARVERFAGPVFSERERVVAGARAGVLTRPRRGLSALPLGDAVAEHLQDMAGYKPESTTWSARREESGRWLVQVSFVSRAKQRTAGWRYDPASNEVAAVDAWSAALAHVDAPPARRDASTPARSRRATRTSVVVPGRSIGVAPPDVPVAERAPARPAARRPAARPAAAAAARPVAAARPAPAARQQEAGVVAARPAAARAVAPRPAAARPPTAARAAVAKAGPSRAAAAKAPATPAVAKTPVQAGRKAAAAPAAQASRPPVTPTHTPVDEAVAVVATDRVSPAAAATRGDEPQTPSSTTSPGEAVTAAPGGPPTLRVVPSPAPDPGTGDDRSSDGDAPPADREAEPAAARPAARRATGGRATVPVWADVLMGTRSSSGAEPERRGD